LVSKLTSQGAHRKRKKGQVGTGGKRKKVTPKPGLVGAGRQRGQKGSSWKGK